MPGSSATGDSPLFYWDSCVLLSYINTYEDRVANLDAMLKAARARRIRICTSTLSITEVAFAQSETMQRGLSEDEERKIDALWMDGVITPVEVDVLISRDARSLMREVRPLGWKLSAPDAIHLATARRLNVTECQTYDHHLFKYANRIGRKVCVPDFDVQYPLPDSEDRNV